MQHRRPVHDRRPSNALQQIFFKLQKSYARGFRSASRKNWQMLDATLYRDFPGKNL
jgi:hypothetical protein